MAEKLIRYYQFYDKTDDYYSNPITEAQLITQLKYGITLTPPHGKITFEVCPIMLTERQFKEENFNKDN